MSNMNSGQIQRLLFEVRRRIGFPPSLVLSWVGFILLMISSWLTHVVICFQDDRWGFLIAGALFFPVAVAHGIGHWFGAW